MHIFCPKIQFLVSAFGSLFSFYFIAAYFKVVRILNRVIPHDDHSLSGFRIPLDISPLFPQYLHLYPSLSGSMAYQALFPH